MSNKDDFRKAIEASAVPGTTAGDAAAAEAYTLSFITAEPRRDIAEVAIAAIASYESLYDQSPAARAGCGMAVEKFLTLIASPDLFARIMAPIVDARIRMGKHWGGDTDRGGERLQARASKLGWDPNLVAGTDSPYRAMDPPTHANSPFIYGAVHRDDPNKWAFVDGDGLQIARLCDNDPGLVLHVLTEAAARRKN